MAIKGGDGSIILTTKVDDAGIKNGLRTIKKATLAMSAAIGVATVSITKMAVSSYAEYEQLVGGVETLFKKSSKKVIEYAHQAFFTAGVSANEYMKQVTSFSASLIKSTAGDTEKAADIANMALIDISDNVNKMGSSAESVTLAYQGFAKQQYQLLDNLKLGYGGTKTEMERLLKDAETITGIKYDINNLADVYSAIHTIQEELDIAGTTAKEAEKTISGSANMTKAAWENVLTAVAGGGDLDIAITNLVYSIQKLFINIVPVVEKALNGIGRLIEQIAPMLVETVARALIRAIPSLINAVYGMIVGAAKGIWDGIKSLFSGGSKDVSKQMASGFGGVADAVNDASENMSDLGDSIDEAGEKAKKSLASFDKIEILSSNESKKSETPAFSFGGGVAESDFDAMQQEENVNKTLTSIGELVGKALVALGVLLAFTGHLALGLGFIIAGAVQLNIGEEPIDWDYIKTTITDVFEEYKGLIAGIAAAMAILGVMLIITGAGFALGIGMLIAGSAVLVADAIINWGYVKTEITSFFSKHKTLIAGIAAAMAIIGVFLLMVGASIPLGVAMIAAGSVVLVADAVLNWEYIKTEITTFFRDHKGLIAGIAAAMAILGVFLLLVGANISLAVALIAAGSVVLVADAVLNWEYIKTTIKNFFKDNAGLIAGISVALLILGVMLLLSGVKIILGISLIVAGASALGVLMQTLDWEYLKNEITTFFTDNAGLIAGISAAMLILGVFFLLIGVKIALAIGMIIAGSVLLVAEAILNWDYIVDKITTFFRDNAGLISGIAAAMVIIGVFLLFTGVATPLAIGLIVAGGASLVGEAILNWGYLKEKINSFISENSALIVGVSLALVVIGILLIFSGAGFGLGFGLLLAGGVALGKAVTVNWDTIYNKIKEVWEKIKKYWNENIAQYFTATWWGNLAITAINGLIKWMVEGINKLIRKLNSFGFTLPDILGGGWVGFDIDELSVPQIPKLAKGAVLPANHPFLAVVGDQKHGTNLEAPAELIKQMAKEAIIEAGGMGGGQTVREEHYYLDETELMSVIYRLVKGGERLNGSSLVTGGAY